MKHDHTFKKQYLIYYLSSYLSKRHIQMKDFMKNIKHEIMCDRPISKSQFQVLLKYLMKEKQFTDVSEEKVTQFFIDFIRNNHPKPKKEKHYEPQPADLTDFL
jgi:hypothetical protein